jgi:hypothetical protein
MDWTRDIEKNRQALLAIVAGLIAVVGLQMSREVRLQVLRILRPAESAVRRLIVIAARGLTLKPRARTPMPMPMPMAVAKQLRLRRKGHVRRPVFQLADPFAPMVEPAHKRYAKQGPRISSIAPPDPTVTAIFAVREPKPPVPATPVDTTQMLKRRLEAIQLALGDLPKQARRLLRWKARRAALAAQRPILTSPLRPGRAPYLPKVLIRNVDFVLERCHLLARDAARADTS